MTITREDMKSRSVGVPLVTSGLLNVTGETSSEAQGVRDSLPKERKWRAVKRTIRQADVSEKAQPAGWQAFRFDSEVEVLGGASTGLRLEDLKSPLRA